MLKRRPGLEKQLKREVNHYFSGGDNLSRFSPSSVASHRGSYVSESRRFDYALQPIVVKKQVDVVWFWPIKSVEPLLLTVGNKQIQPKPVQ